MGKISRSPRYVIDILRTHPIDWGWVVNSDVTQISYFKSQPDPASLGGAVGGGTGNIRKYLKRRDQGETGWEE